MYKTTSPYIKFLNKTGVNWEPFTKSTLDRAVKEDKMIFVHIGNNAHITERQLAFNLFSNSLVIKVLNNDFISIAIDIEDVPEINIIALDLLIINEHRIGYPINIFSLPKSLPFTSFSNLDICQFLALSQNIIDAYKHKRYLLYKAGLYLSKKLKYSGSVNEKNSNVVIKDKLLHAYVKTWASRFLHNDQENLTTSPYTVCTRYMLFLLQYSIIYNKTTELDKIESRIDDLLFSPMFDPIDGGIFSQSEYSDFRSPLFEKNLSENAQSAIFFSMAYKQYNKIEYKIASQKIIQFIESKLKSKKGTYYTSITLNAPSVKVSKYYKYSLKEIKCYFPSQHNKIIKYLGMQLNCSDLDYQLVSNTSYTPYINDSEIATLKQIRAKRKEVIIDKRTITAYNSLYASALCIIAHNIPCKYNEYMNLAENIVKNILNKQKAGDIQLYRYISAKKTEFSMADLHDYSLFLNALLRLQKCTNDTKYQALINKYTAYILLNYYNDKNGMFKETAKNINLTPYKRESVMDYTKYSQNSIMARNLFLLHKLNNDKFYLDIFKQQLYNIEPCFIGSGPLMVGWALQILNYLNDK